MDVITTLLKKIRSCCECEKHLPYGPRPIISFSKESRILIVGQAPGRRVHKTGIPWDDPSGNRLREWMGVDRETFYDSKKIALVPMGFCYPGTGKSGDLPPREECAPLWHEKILSELLKIKLTLLVSQYAQKYYLGSRCKFSVTETVRTWKKYGPTYIPLPHPSPRNNIWLKKNPWFEKQLIPDLREQVFRILNAK